MALLSSELIRVGKLSVVDLRKKTYTITSINRFFFACHGRDNSMHPGDIAASGFIPQPDFLGQFGDTRQNVRILSLRVYMVGPSFFFGFIRSS
jgi:hypothetical protein